MNNTTAIQEEYPLSFNVNEPIYKIDDDRFSIIFNGSSYGLIKDDKIMPDGLWNYVMNMIEENPKIVTPMPEPEPLPEIKEPLEPEEQVDVYSFVLGLMGKENDTQENKEGLQLRKNINVLEKQVQGLGEQVQEVAVR